MKYFFLFLVLFPCIQLVAQSNDLPVSKQMDSVLKANRFGINGNSNIVTILQGKITVVYDLRDKKQADLFMAYLAKLPGVDRNLKQLLRVGRKVVDLLGRYYNGSSDKGVLDTHLFLDKIDAYVRENERLRIEIERLKIGNPSLASLQVIKEACSGLKNFDNALYQRKLEEFKHTVLTTAGYQAGYATYLEALNSRSTHDFQTAIRQIDEAMGYDPNEAKYIVLKGRLIGDPNRYGAEVRGRKEDNNWGYSFFNFVDSAISWYKGTLASVNFRHDSCYGVFLSDLGMLYYWRRQYDRAVKYFNGAISVFEENCKWDDSCIARCYFNLGSTYSKWIKGDSCVYYYLKAADLCHVDPGGMRAKIYNNIGLFYFRNSAPDKALKYLKLAVKLEKNSYGEGSPGTDVEYINIGTIYLNWNKVDEAIDNYRTALSIELKDRRISDVGVAMTYRCLSKAYCQKGDLDNGYNCGKKALEIFLSHFGDRNSMAMTEFASMGSISYKMRNFDTCVGYLNRIVVFFESDSNRRFAQMDRVYECLGDAYYGKDKFDSANFFYTKSLSCDAASLGKRDTLRSGRYFKVAQSLFKGKECKGAMKYLLKAVGNEKEYYGSNDLLDSLESEIGRILELKNGEWDRRGEEVEDIFARVGELLRNRKGKADRRDANNVL